MIKKIKILVDLDFLADWVKESGWKDNIEVMPYDFCGYIHCESQQQSFFIGFLDDLNSFLGFLLACQKKIHNGILTRETYHTCEVYEFISLSTKNNSVIMHDYYSEGFKDEIMSIEEFEYFCNMYKQALLRCIKELDIENNCRKCLLDDLDKYVNFESKFYL